MEFSVIDTTTPATSPTADFYSRIT